MRSFVALRLAAQLSLCAALLCLFAPFRADWLMFALLCLLAAGAALGAASCRRPALRLALGLLPALALFLASGWMSLAAGAALTLCAAAVLTAGRFSVELWQYRQEVLALAALSALLALLSALAGFRSPSSRGFAAACLLLLLSALRARRLGAADSAAWEGGSLGLFLLPLAGGAALGALLWALVPALQFLFRGVGALFAGILYLWNSFWGRILHHVDTIGDDFFADETTPPPSYYSAVTDAPGDAPNPQNEIGPRLPDASLPWETILAVLGALALLALVIWLLRRANKPAPRQAPDAAFKTERPQDPPRRSRSRRRGRRETADNRSRLRAVYRSYLAFLRRNGLALKPDATSANVTEQAASLLVEGDEPLRQLYRRARYGAAMPSERELQAAEEALARLTAEENLRKNRPRADRQTSGE